MGKKKNKNKKKKVNPKRALYTKFRKDKPASMTFFPPDLTPEQQKQRLEDDGKIGMFLRYNRSKRTTQGIGAKSKG